MLATRSPGLIRRERPGFIRSVGESRFGRVLDRPRRVSVAAAYVADAAEFDGTNDYLSRGADLTGNADGKQLSMSFWVDLTGGDGSTLVFYQNTGGRVDIVRDTGNKLDIRLLNAAGGTIFRLVSNTTMNAAAGLQHVIFSCDLATAAYNLYFGETSDSATPSTNINDTIDFTQAEHTIFAATNGTLKMPGCLFDFWLAQSYIDFSQQANRRLFRNSSGKPVDLGAAGSKPGVTPILFFHLDDGETADNFGVNAGTGGGFTVNGALATCGTSPTD